MSAAAPRWRRPQQALVGALLILLQLLCPAVRAEELSWDLALEPGHVAHLRLLDDQGLELAVFRCADGVQNDLVGWRPDTDPTPGRVQGSVELWLSPGTYTVREELPGGVQERELTAVTTGGRMLRVQLSAGAHGVVAWQRDERLGHNALAWAPAFGGGVTFLTIGPGAWRAHQLGASTPQLDVRDDAELLTFQVPGDWSQQHLRGRRQGEHAWLVRLGLLPVTLLFLGLGAWGLWRARRASGLPLAVGVALATGLAAVGPALLRLGSVLLLNDPANTDPPDSVAQVAAIAQALPRLSDISASFGFPEGASWVANGPSWLGYLLPAALTWVSGPLVGHNLGVGLHLALLALAAWALARSLGAGPRVALLAGVAPCLAASMLDELDQLSIDRSTFFLVPIFFLCLHRAAQERGWRWPLAAGAALAAVFYGQVHYGLYLCAAAPLLVLPRLVGASPHLRLARMALVGVVALLIMAPGLHLLLAGTADTPYQQDQATLRTTATDLWHPVDAREVSEFIRNNDPKYRGGAEPPMGTPKDRLLTAVSRSLTVRAVVEPYKLLPGGGLYWGLVLLAIVAARRRSRALLATLDVAVLLLFALGPLARTGPTSVSVPLPYYLDFLFVPGFEQLKQLNRYLVMALSISAVPLALGVQGVVERAGERLAWLRSRWALALGAVAACGLALTLDAVHVQVVQLLSMGAPGANLPMVQLSVELPEVQPQQAPAALAGLGPGSALALPVEHPISPAVSISAMQAGLRLVNEAPFGSSSQGGSYWFETNALLNQAVLSAGSARAGQVLSLEDPERSLRDLRANELRYVVLFRDRLLGPELSAPAEAVLDAHLTRVADDGSVAVWEVP